MVTLTRGSSGSSFSRLSQTSVLPLLLPSLQPPGSDTVLTSLPKPRQEGSFIASSLNHHSCLLIRASNRCIPHLNTMTTNLTSPAPPTSIEDQRRAANQAAFSRDLEFLSSLANPYYLNHLALSNVLSSPSFQRYLKYLDYFRHPRYVKYLQYPQALHFLDLLQSEEEFRMACRDLGFVGEVMAKQVGHWATWRDPEGDVGDGQEGEQGGEDEQTA